MKRCAAGSLGSGFALVTLAAAVWVGGCSKDGAAPTQAPPAATAPDISGVWAGTWSGQDAFTGTVTGNWEAEVAQTDAGVTGTVAMSGDVDCPDGTLSGAIGEDRVVSGALDRPPCPANGWTLTALNFVERSASGVWTQPGRNAAGTFTGTQIAKTGGPRIAFFHPPGGTPGAIVTLVGTGFDASAAADLLELDGMPAEVSAASATTIVARVPRGGATGPLYLTTPAGTALSPRPFDAAVSFPRTASRNAIAVGAAPEAVAVSPDGRKAYVANRADGTVSMIDTRTGFVLATTSVSRGGAVLPVQALAPSPDGRRLYAASGVQGVTVLEAATNRVLDVVPVPVGWDAPNPHGLAVTPDARTLLVSENRDGGAAFAIDVATRAILRAVAVGPGAAPSGVAASPDGRTAYLAFRGAGGGVRALDLATGEIAWSVSTISAPVGLAVTPDGARLYASDADAGAVWAIDVETRAAHRIDVGGAPAGLAATPDGTRVLVACQGSGTVSVIDRDLDAVVETFPVGASPVGVAMSPDGKRAYVATSGSGSVVEVGGPATLTIAKAGSGIGTVLSSPDGIQCGTTCTARWEPGTAVTLTAIPDSGATFDGWSGGCSGGSTIAFELTESRSCTATFTYAGGGGGGGGPIGDVPPVSGGYCFVATAAYGSALAPEVAALRGFRDRHLLTNAPGRAFVAAYYALSPPLARAIARHDALRAAVRWTLAPVVLSVNHPLAALAVALAGVAAALARSRRARRWLAAWLLGLAACGGDGGGEGGPSDRTPPGVEARPAGGSYGTVQYVTLTTDEPATIHYTVDGSAPVPGAPGTRSGDAPLFWVRAGPGTTKIRFVAVDLSGNRSAERTETYVVDATVPVVTRTGPLPAPVGLLGSAALAWRSDVAGTFAVRLSGAGAETVIATGDVEADAPMTQAVHGWQLAYGAPSTLRVEVTGRNGNVGAASVEVRLKAPLEASSCPLGCTELALLPDGGKAYLAAGTGLDVVDTDPASGTYHSSLGTIDCGLSQGWMIRLAPTADSASVYGTATVPYGAPDVKVVRTATDTCEDVAAVGYGQALAVTPDGSRLYVAWNGIGVLDLDPASPTYRQVIATISGAGTPDALVIARGGRRAVASSGGALYVLDLDPASPTYHEVVPSGAAIASPAYGLPALSPDGRTAYALACLPDCGAWALDLSTYAWTPPPAPFSGFSSASAVTADGAHLLVAGALDDRPRATVHVFRTADLAHLGEVSLEGGDRFDHVVRFAPSPDGTRVYALLAYPPRLVVLPLR